MLSIIVITKNEQDRIKACLESIKWADEIIIADNSSTDATLEIAKKYTNRILHFNQFDFAEIRNRAMNVAKGEWVLYIDADERILNPLKQEIPKLLTSEKSAYAISRKNIIFGQEVNYGPYQKDWVIRLFKKSKFKRWIGKIHEYGTFEGELGYCQNSLLHLTHRNVDQFVLKALGWSKLDAQLQLESGHPRMVGWRFLRILITEFFHQGIIRRGFFSGTVGIVDSVLQVFSFYISYVRLWQMQQPKPLEEIYNEIDKKLIENNFNYK